MDDQMSLLKGFLGTDPSKVKPCRDPEGDQELYDTPPAEHLPCEDGKCDGSGMLPPPDGDPVGRWSHCSCTKKQRQRARLERLAKQSLMPPGLLEKRFKGFQVARAREQAKRVRAWVDQFTPHGPGLLLYSRENGVGKTHLAAAAANTLLSKGHAVLFVLVPDLAGKLVQRDEHPQEIVQAMMDAPVLVMDDIGQSEEGAAEWRRAELRRVLFNVLTHREQNHLPIIGTTNLGTKRSFDDALGKAATSRLFGLCDGWAISFAGLEDYRLRGFQE